MNTKDYAVMFLHLYPKKMIEFIKLFADDNTIARMESYMLSNNPSEKNTPTSRKFQMKWSKKMYKYKLVVTNSFKK